MARKRYGRRRSARRTKKQPGWKKMAGIAVNTALDYASSVPGPVGVVAKGLQMVKNLINVETKFVDTTINDSPDNTTGVITPLTLVAQGATDSTRNGNSILAKSLDIRFAIGQHATATNTQVLALLILDKENAQGTAPTIAQILQAASTQSFMNMDNSDRFIVLRRYQKSQVLASSTRLIEVEDHIGLTDLHVKFDGTAATQANATENHIYLVSISSEATNKPVLSGYARFKFMDN